MRLEHVVSLAISRVLGGLVRRVAMYAIAVLFVLGVIYELTVAGTLALTELYGPVVARLIVAGIDAFIVIVAAVVLYVTRARPAAAGMAGAAPPQLPGLTDARIAMLIESALFGYSLARDKTR